MVDGCSETWWTHFNLVGWLAKVNLADLISHEKYIPESIGAGGPYGYRQSLESGTDLHVTALPCEPALVLDPAHLVPGPILYRWQLFWKWLMTNMVAAGGSRHSQSLMGPLQVVDSTPVIEGLLAMRQVFKSDST